MLLYQQMLAAQMRQGALGHTGQLAGRMPGFGLARPGAHFGLQAQMNLMAQRHLQMQQQSRLAGISGSGSRYV